MVRLLSPIILFYPATQGEGAKVTELWGSTLYHRQDVPYKNVDSIPNTYTQFRKVRQTQYVCFNSIILNSV